MEELIAKLEEILEVENLDVTKNFEEYDEWDSLSSLSILAMLDSDYHTSMKAKDITSFDNIEAFCIEVLSRQ
jgi:acyl carrier protein